MPEILTESFCERCGTRYTFESAAPRTARLKGIRVLSRGFKNFVMSDDTSIDEAMAAARSETDREVTSQQLDAFHKTFNFCMSCRQYTCANCWNEAEGRCLTCAPHLGHDILTAPFPDLDLNRGFTVTNVVNGANGTDGSGHVQVGASDSLAWPTMDLDPDLVSSDEAGSTDIEPIDAAARLAALGATAQIVLGADAIEQTVTDIDTAETAAQLEAESAAIDRPEPTVVETEPDLEVATADEIVAQEPQVAAADEIVAQEPQVAIVPADIAGRAAAAAAQTTGLLRRFRPGQSLDAEIEAFEREQAAVVAPDEVLDVAPDLDPAPALEAMPSGEAVQIEPVAADAPAVHAADDAASDPMPHEDRVEQPTWRIVAPDAPSSGRPPTRPTTEPPASPAAPEWPAQPEWPSQGRAAAGLPFLGRPAQPTGTLESLWAESAREVVSTPISAPAPMTLGGTPVRATGGVQPCVSCGLSLSATARFCRRCGASQG